MKILKRKYSGLLAQLSPSFIASPENMRRLRHAGQVFRHLATRYNVRNTARLFIEFRHPSWCTAWRDASEMKVFCRKAHLDIVQIVAQGRWNRLLTKTSYGVSVGVFPKKTEIGSIWPGKKYVSNGSTPTYIRLHGTQGKYRGWYDRKKLMKVLHTNTGCRKHHTCYLAFNNTMWGSNRPKSLAACVSRKNDSCAICNAITVSRFLK